MKDFGHWTAVAPSVPFGSSNFTRPDMLQDLRYAARTLRRSAGFTLVTVLTLALGIGATTAVFSLVNTILIQPLPWDAADRLVVMKHTAPGLDIREAGQSLGTYFHYVDRSRLFEYIGMYNENVVNLRGDVDAERVQVGLVSPSVFAALGARAAVGRLFRPDEPNAGDAVVISHDLWRRQYGGDSSIVGRTIELNSAPKLVVGVMQPGFDFPRPETQVWYTTAVERPARLGVGLSSLFYSAVGRLRSGVTIAAAEAELNRLIASMPEAYGDVTPAALADAQLRAVVRPLKDEIVGDVGSNLWLVLGGTLLVLVIACANIANLFLIRSEQRQREIALRTALGASRAQIVRHALGESVLIALLGAAVGLFVADTGVQLLAFFGPRNLPRLHEVAVDAWAVGFAACLTAAAALLFGAMPILGRTRPDLTSALKEGARSATSGPERQHARSLLVVSQFALALALLVSSALFVQSFWRLRQLDLGFEPAGVLTMEIALPNRPYPDYASRAALWRRLLERTRVLPGVQAAGAATSLPLAGGWIDAYLEDPVVVEGRAVNAGEPAERVLFAAFTPGYFEAMEIPLVAGRRFAPGDRADGSNPVLVSAALAARLFPGESALGKRVRRVDYEGRDWHTIVGVVGSVRRASVSGPPDEVLYVPVLDREMGMFPTHMSIAIQTTLPPLELTGAVRQIVRDIDPALPIANVRTMERIVAEATARTTFTMLLLSIAAAGALFLGALGVYGIVSYSIGRRTHEIGIRIALGARASDVVRMVLRQGSRVVLAGLAAGVVIALAVSRLLRGLLFEVSPTDPLTIVGMCLLLVAVAIVACWFPTRRAARVDPAIALRSE